MTGRRLFALIGSLLTLPLALTHAGWTDDYEAALIKARAACASETGVASVFVNISDIASVEGNIRAQIYSDKEDDFLEKGKKLVRVDVPVTDYEQSLCVPLPAAGSYSLVILHDKNANGKADFFSEGFGFANNPKIRFGPPDVEEATFVASAGVTELDIKLNYILGGDSEDKKKRRALRRRR